MITCGVPQGPILEPWLSVQYLLDPRIQIKVKQNNNKQKKNVNNHIYADDTHLFRKLLWRLFREWPNLELRFGAWQFI